MTGNIKKLLASISLFICSPLIAGELDIPQKPLNMSSVKSNILFVIDDSGSMDYQFITQPHYEYCNYFNPGGTNGCSNTLHNDASFHYPTKFLGRFFSQDYHYIFAHKNVFSGRKAIDKEALVAEEWRMFDSDFNKLYFDVSHEYIPWKGPCEGDSILTYKSCENADPLAVHAHPHKGSANYSTTINTTNHYHNSKRFVHRFVVSIDDKGFAGAVPTPGDITEGANGMIDPTDTHIMFSILSPNSLRATKYTTDTSGNVSSTNLLTFNAGTCYNALASKDNIKSIISGEENISDTGGEDCRTPEQVIQNYANWLQYYYRRGMAARAAVSHIIEMFPNNYFALSYLNKNKNKVTVPFSNSDTDLSDFNTNLINNYLKQKQEYVGTPLVTGLNTAGRYFGGELTGGSPIKFACQTNNALVISDGQWSEKDNDLPQFGDVDGDGYGSNGSSLSDVAYHYYKKDLSSFENIVPTNDWDTSNKQHMVTYGISFGVQGNLVAGENTWPNPALDRNSNWGDPFCGARDCPAKIDDLWHAAYNSRGAFVQANNIDELERGLQTTLSLITTGQTPSLNGVAASSRLLNNTKVYQGTFNTKLWSGNLIAYNISNDGVLSSTPVFETGILLDKKKENRRIIYTHNGSRGILFQKPKKWNKPIETEISKLQSQALLGNVTSKKNKYVKNAVEYLRGNKKDELSNGGILRNRVSIHGDIVNSSPVYISPPDAKYKDADYSAFKMQYSQRKPMVAVGANDGMLHIFDAENGNEMMGYVPGYIPMWQNLANYILPNYEHRYFVNASPTVADFKGNNGWKTIVTGSLGAGGQMVYGLDVTTANFKNQDSDAQNTVMWEFSDKDDADMGYVLGKVHVAKMANNKWAVVFGNGYNSTKGTYPSGGNDKDKSSNKQAALFVLFIEEGTDKNWKINKDYIKILVGPSNKNGLSEPFLVDIDGDGIVDYVYAGDLNGEMWRFDVRDSKTSNWSSHKVYSTTSIPGSGQQPIIQPPVVGKHPLGVDQGVMVYFGTGKHIEPTDMNTANQPTQAMYGIWDKLGSTPSFNGDSKLLKQKIEFQIDNLRSASNYDIDWNTHLGWMLPLEAPYGSDGKSGIANKGEKVTGKPILRNGNIIFVSTVPADGSTQDCSGQTGTSWLMEISSINGGRLSYAVFDVDKDGKFDKKDYLKYTNSQGEEITIPHSGIKSESGESHESPTIISTPKGDKEVKVTSGLGGINAEAENPGNSANGRQSWQEVY